MITIGDFVVDATLSEDHTFDADVTDHPVEQGGNITDNVRPKPFVVAYDCIVSDSPIDPVALLRPDGSVPSADAYTAMYNLWTSRQPTTVTDSLGTFTNMVLRTLGIPRTAKEGGALHFKATFEQIIIVTNSRALVRVSSPSNASQQNLGNKATKDGAATAKTEGDMVTNKTHLQKVVQYFQNQTGL